MKYIHATIQGYLKDLGSRSPAPGGGSAAALASAMAASLIAMACQYTLGKERYKKSEPRIKEILAQSLQLRKRLSDLVDEDIEAYLRHDLKRSIMVPAEVCHLSYHLMMLADEVMDRGNKNLITDAGLAALLAEVGFTSCFFYVRINDKFLKVRTKKHAMLLRELTSLLKKVKRLRKKAEVRVGYFIGR